MAEKCGLLLLELALELGHSLCVCVCLHQREERNRNPHFEDSSVTRKQTFRVDLVTNWNISNVILMQTLYR